MAENHPPATPSLATIDLKNQSILLEGPERIRVSSLVDAANGEYVKTPEPRKLYDMFLEGEKRSGNGNCLGTRSGEHGQYVWKSYKKVNTLALQFGSALLEKGFKEEKEEKYIGIYAKNREEWAITDIACVAFNIMNVPLYDTLGVDSTKYIINLVGIPVVVCDTSEKVQKLLALKPELDSLRLIVVMDGPIPESMAAEAKEANVELVTFEDMEKLGMDNTKEPSPGGSDDIATICFTSGTTGDPKGVMLTQDNLLHLGRSLQSVGIEVSPADRYLSFLPLAHIAERGSLWTFLPGGTEYGFYSGDPKMLLDDIATLKPTVFGAVPRVLTRIYDKITAGVNSANVVKRSLFNLAFNSKRKTLLETGMPTTDSVWDKFVFKKIQMLLGGRLRAMVTGAAPIHPDVLTFMRVVFGVVMAEAYGQTESSSVISITLTTDITSGHVGPPLPNLMVKLVDVPEKEYHAKDDQGEICFKGSNVFKGYYKKPELTAAALDEDGWLHTGDVGQWTENGTLKIIDRKKHIFKLSQGEYVAPEKLENIYGKCPLVAQIFVHGESTQAFLVAVVVPDEEELVRKASSKEEWKGDFVELCANEHVKDDILNDMKNIADSSKLNGFEKVRDIYIHPKLFSIEDGLLTPTLKAKRPALEKAFKENLSELYSKHSSSS